MVSYNIKYRENVKLGGWESLDGMVYEAEIPMQALEEGVSFTLQVSSLSNEYASLPAVTGSLQEANSRIVVIKRENRLSMRMLAINMAAAAAVITVIFGLMSLLVGKLSLAVLGLGSGITYLIMLLILSMRLGEKRGMAK